MTIYKLFFITFSFVKIEKIFHYQLVHYPQPNCWRLGYRQSLAADPTKAWDQVMKHWCQRLITSYSITGPWHVSPSRITCFMLRTATYLEAWRCNISMVSIIWLGASPSTPAIACPSMTLVTKPKTPLCDEGLKAPLQLFFNKGAFNISHLLQTGLPEREILVFKFNTS